MVLRRNHPPVSDRPAASQQTGELAALSSRNQGHSRLSEGDDPFYLHTECTFIRAILQFGEV